MAGNTAPQYLEKVEHTTVKKVEAQEVKPPEPVVQAPVPVVERPPNPVGCEHYRNLVSQYNWNINVALAVMKAESGCNPNSVGDNFPINGLYAPSCGLFQIRTLAGRPSCDQLKDPSTNVQWAFKLYSGSGWKPWSVCKNGKVSCY